MKLTEAEQKKIAAGAMSISRKEKPDCEKGERIVAIWSEARRAAVGEDKALGLPAAVWDVPAEPLIVITVREIIRQLRGWNIRFDVEDYRDESDRYLAKQHGRAPISYVSNPSQAIDDVGVIGKVRQERYSAEANERDLLREQSNHPDRVADRDLLRKRNRLVKLQQEARRKKVDISPELSAAIDAVQAKLRENRAA